MRGCAPLCAGNDLSGRGGRSGRQDGCGLRGPRTEALGQHRRRKTGAPRLRAVLAAARRLWRANERACDAIECGLQGRVYGPHRCPGGLPPAVSEAPALIGPLGFPHEPRKRRGPGFPGTFDMGEASPPLEGTRPAVNPQSSGSRGRVVISGDDGPVCKRNHKESDKSPLHPAVHLWDSVRG